MGLASWILSALLSKPNSPGACDIYASGGTPCVAAHSSVRCLYAAYDGPLYEVKRLSDNTTTDVHPLRSGGVANAATQDKFCRETTCLITTIYDQSGRGNHLTPAPPGGAASGPEEGGYDSAAGATGAAVTVGGHKAYGVFTSPGVGYRNDDTDGVATGNDPEGIYAVFDGTHFNNDCCWDYGNAETNNLDEGPGTMEALYFGDEPWGKSVRGAGKGPWIQGDLEDGLWAGGADNQPGGINPRNPSIDYRFVTGILKGNDTNYWALRGGNAQRGTLSNFYGGPRPTQPAGSQQYYPMRKRGAIILGIGGDNSIRSQGTFYEGAMTSGFPSDETENKVQANIVAAGYATTSQSTGAALKLGQAITVQNSQSSKYLGAASDGNVVLTSHSSSTTFKVAAPLQVHSGCYSFQCVSAPGSYLRHYDFQLFCDDPTATSRSPGTFADDATFCLERGFSTLNANAFRSYSYPSRYWRQMDNGQVFIGQQGGPFSGDSWENFNGQASWVVHTK